jgi:hypothetical protein
VTKLDLWNRAVDAMREDDDPRWHAVADWLRSEANVHAEMEPFIELLNCAFEQKSGIKGYLRFGRRGDGEIAFQADTNEGATAVALAYLDAAQPTATPEAAGDGEAGR